MYSAKYSAKGNSRIRSYDIKLEANFDFRNETSPQDKEVVKERLVKFCGLRPLNVLNGFLDERVADSGQFFLCYTYFNAFNNLGMTLTVEPFNQGYEFQMRDVNLEAIDHYILTGEMPEKE